MAHLGQKTTDLNTSREVNASGGGANTLLLYFLEVKQAQPLLIQNLGMGSSWTELNDLSTARSYIQGSGWSK